jgi:hypothetical protein
MVLAKAALVDMRTIGEEDVLAWHEIVHRLDFADALDAVPRHYAETRERLMPADLIRHTRSIRDERKRLEAKHPVRELPGRFETDEERDARNRENADKIRRQVIAPLVARMSIGPEWQTTKVEASGAWWEDEAKRETHAKVELNRIGRLHPAAGDERNAQ